MSPLRKSYTRLKRSYLIIILLGQKLACLAQDLFSLTNVMRHGLLGVVITIMFV